MRTLFESASGHAPAIVFIDEIDAIAPKRGEGGAGGSGGESMEKRIVAQLLTSMDAIHPKNTRNQAAVMVLGATNRPDAMDPALRRAGRFDREIVLGAPDEKAREGILRVMTQNMRVDDSLDYGVLAKKTPGFVGADIRSLTKEAAVVAINRIFQNELLDGCVSGCSDIAAAQSGEETSKENKEGLNIRTQNEARIIAARSTSPLTPEQLHPLYITMDDFLSAVSSVQPSAKREGFATVPDVCWDDIGALANIREELTLSVLEPIRHPERFVALGLPLPAGVLLYGPPGCGKVRFTSLPLSALKFEIAYWRVFIGQQCHRRSLQKQLPTNLVLTSFRSKVQSFLTSTLERVNDLCESFLNAHVPAVLVSSSLMNWIHYVLNEAVTEVVEEA